MASIESMDDSQRQQYFMQIAQMAQLNYQHSLLLKATNACHTKCTEYVYY